MKFHLIKSKQVFANQRNRLWVMMFILITACLLAGVVYLILPNVEFIITPHIQNIALIIPIKIDLDLNEPIYNLNAISGRLLKINEVPHQLEQQGYKILNIGRSSVVYSSKDYNQLIINSIQKSIPQGWVAININYGWPEADWQMSSSGRQINAILKFDTQIMPDFPYSVWKEHLAGKSISEAVSWLKLRPGVSKVRFVYFSFFLAEISQKVPRLTSRIKFSLDI
ncbi:MAG: hypothetical protein V1712_00975 [Patescibacteria group bacterium]